MQTSPVSKKETGEIGGSVGAKRIAKNTLMLYFRQILIMLVSLYTVRVVLATLGTEDYGVYSVVAGVVTMFGFLSNVMATSSQRYFSYAMGQGDDEGLTRTFGISLTIYLLLMALVLVLAETIGLWYVNNMLVVPDGRLGAANWVYQAVVVSFMFTLVTSPYMASIIAHEDMSIYAYMSVLEAGLKLVIVFLLKVIPFDKLIAYGLLLTAVSAVNTSLYRFYCKRHYAECRFRPLMDKRLFRKMLSFSGWNLFGTGATMVKTQGGTLVVNLFFGTAVNAAQGIAASVRNAMLVFSNNFSTAVRPQLTMLYAAGRDKELAQLLSSSCKLMTYLTLIVVAPLFNNLDFIFGLWLDEVPEYTTIFVQLLLIESLVESASTPMATVNQATGRIQVYQAIIGTVLMLTLPITCALYAAGYPPFTLYAVNVGLMCVVVAIRFFFLLQARVDLRFLFKDAVVPLLVTCALSFAGAFFVGAGADGLLAWAVHVSATLAITALLIFLVGLSSRERGAVWHMVKTKLRRS